ncbi:MAG: peptide ABC transporter substrate-binding protein [Candidatus Velthaea sp.]
MSRLLGLLLCACLLAGCTKVGDNPAQPVQSHQAAAPGAPSAARNRATIAHTLRIGDTQDITSLNPHLATALSLNFMSQMTMAYLVRYGHDNRPIPELATVVPTKKNHLISGDGLTITWHLRKGVKWSDGVPFDADDMVFSTNAVNNPQNNEVGRDGWDLITKIDEPDKYTVVFHLKRPYSAFLPTFFGSAGANPCLLPKHLLGTLANINNADYNSKPVGIGPFRYVNWVRGDHVELEANPYYWRGTPKLKKVIFKLIPDSNTLLTQLQTGEVDLWPLVDSGFYDRVKTLSGRTTIHSPGYLYSHLDFNLKRAVFADKAVREALRYAVDRRTLRDKVLHGLGVLQAGPLSPASPLYTALPDVPFDLAKANALLDAAGWKRGADGIRAKGARRLAFDFALTSGSPDADQEVELLRSTWQQIGARINVLHYPSATIFAPYQQGGIVYAGKFDMVTFSWQLTPDGDLSNVYECSQMPPNGQNVLHYCNPKTDALLQQSKAAYDEEQRRPILAAIQKQIIADVPEVVMWIREDVYSYNSDLTGWHPNNTTPFDDMLGVDL